MEIKEPEKRATETEAREVAESARETEWGERSFLRDLFMGRIRLDLIHPHPEPNPDEEPGGCRTSRFSHRCWQKPARLGRSASDSARPTGSFRRPAGTPG